MKEENILKRQYGLFVSICIVVGFIVGTGIFWRPGRVLYEAGGDMWMGVLAWVAGGLIISTCVYMFAIMGSRYEKIHGMVDYAEVVVGKRFGYLAGWFFCVMYQTAGYALIAWISASFTATLAGHDNIHNTPFVFSMTAFYMIMVFVLNYLAPKLPMKLNVTTTILRLIPLIAMGTIGVIVGLVTRDATVATEVVIPNLGEGMAAPSFLGAIFATVFAYNGWQAAAAFNSEIKDSKRNFPIALVVGFLIVMVIYVLYFVGVTSSGSPYDLMANNQLGTRAAFGNVFGDFATNGILIFVIISGLGILNMCCMGMSRGMYSLARRGLGPIPDRMVQLDQKTGVPVCSMITCIGLSFIWLMVLYGNQNNWFGTLNDRPFRFDLADFYNMMFFMLLIPIFIGFAVRNRKNKEVHWFNRYIAPVIGAGGAAFLIYALISSSPIHAAIYTGVFIALALIGFAFMKPWCKSKRISEGQE
ncbi:MAG: APC family permease [Oscillospiraceae bacterium]|nr:APC family permease [Oscillospiraceae bacterium]